MNEERDEKRCYFHPRELVVGVCALCLNERLLLILASNQETHRNHSLALPKIFNLLNRSDTKQHKSEVNHSTSSPSQEDSFISMKLEENGVASWDKGKISKTSYESLDKKTKMIPRGMLRWRRQIGHLFHLIKWKRSSKA